MTSPELAVRSSGYGGRGYAIPATGDLPFKRVKGDAGYIPARLNESGAALIVPSVTTILKAGATPAITQWAVDQTAAYAAINPDAVFTRSQDAAWAYLRHYWRRTPNPLEEGYDLRNYHEGVLHDAADLGTNIHEWIQADVVPECEYPDISNLNSSFFEMTAVWEQWAAGQFIEPIFTECTVWNRDAGYAGTFDCLWKINGKLWLLDIKSARGLWPDHSRQLSALKEADTLFTKDEHGQWQEQPWQPWIEQVDNFGFLHIRPGDIDKDGNGMLPYVDLVEAANLDLHYKAFLGLLQTKVAERELSAREKEEGLRERSHQT